jgi:hypothetical protein
MKHRPTNQPASQPTIPNHENEGRYITHPSIEVLVMDCHGMSCVVYHGVLSQIHIKSSINQPFDIIIIYMIGI